MPYGMMDGTLQTENCKHIFYLLYNAHITLEYIFLSMINDAHIYVAYDFVSYLLSNSSQGVDKTTIPIV